VGCGEHAAIVRRLRYETTAVCVLCPAPVWITVVPTSLQLLQPAAPSCRVRSIDGCRAGGQSAAGEAPVYERLTEDRKPRLCLMGAVDVRFFARSGAGTMPALAKMLVTVVRVGPIYHSTANGIYRCRNLLFRHVNGGSPGRHSTALAQSSQRAVMSLPTTMVTRL
jgi:hypothetical protein